MYFKLVPSKFPTETIQTQNQGFYAYVSIRIKKLKRETTPDWQGNTSNPTQVKHKILYFSTLTRNIKFHINSVSIQFSWSIFLDFFQNKIFNDKSKDGALWSILCFILTCMLRIKKKKLWKISIYSPFFF